MVSKYPSNTVLKPKAGGVPLKGPADFQKGSTPPKAANSNSLPLGKLPNPALALLNKSNPVVQGFKLGWAIGNELVPANSPQALWIAHNLLGFAPFAHKKFFPATRWNFSWCLGCGPRRYDFTTGPGSACCNQVGDPLGTYGALAASYPHVSQIPVWKVNDIFTGGGFVRIGSYTTKAGTGNAPSWVPQIDVPASPGLNPQAFPIEFPIAVPFAPPKAPPFPVNPPAPGEEPSTDPDAGKEKSPWATPAKNPWFDLPVLPGIPGVINPAPGVITIGTGMDVVMFNDGQLSHNRDKSPGNKPSTKGAKNPFKGKRPGKNGEMEKKPTVVTVVAGWTWTAINTVTEAKDFVLAMHDALPKRLQLSKKASNAQKVKYMMSHLSLWGSLRLDKAIANYINMQVGDFVAAIGSEQTKNLAQEMGKSTGLDRALAQQQELQGAGALPIPKLDIDFTTGQVSLSNEYGAWTVDLLDLSSQVSVKGK